MKISTRGRYATRALLALAAHHGDGLVHISELAAGQSISRKYLENILLSLKVAGLVHSERGKNGGYALSKPPAEITMYDILYFMEDSLDFVPCTGDGVLCDRSSNCATREFWVELKQKTEAMLRESTLADLLRRQTDLDAAAQRRAAPSAADAAGR